MGQLRLPKEPTAQQERQAPKVYRARKGTLVQLARRVMRAHREPRVRLDRRATLAVSVLLVLLALLEWCGRVLGLMMLTMWLMMSCFMMVMRG